MLNLTDLAVSREELNDMQGGGGYCRTRCYQPRTYSCAPPPPPPVVCAPPPVTPTPPPVTPTPTPTPSNCVVTSGVTVCPTVPAVPAFNTLMISYLQFLPRLTTPAFNFC